VEELFTRLRNLGFVRYHPENGEIYLDDGVEDALNALFETGTSDALEVREWLSRMRFEGNPFLSAP
jgi:hypothetical protein